MEKVPKKEIRAALKKGGALIISPYTTASLKRSTFGYTMRDFRQRPGIYMKIRETNGIFCNT